MCKTYRFKKYPLSMDSQKIPSPCKYIEDLKNLSYYTNTYKYVCNKNVLVRGSDNVCLHSWSDLIHIKKAYSDMIRRSELSSTRM